MDITLPTPLLGGLSPQVFMRKHWQKKPLLIRAAVSGEAPIVSRNQLFELAAQDDVESRLVLRQMVRKDVRWSMRQGPFKRAAIPPLKQAGWTLLVQGLDLHLPAAHDLLSRFRFVPDSRLDDLMVSYASDAGGVGPHVDSYDVFLLQVQGRRRWRIGPLQDSTLVADVPLKILANFKPEEEWLLEPGDMLYLPPGWAHDGVAEGECLTASIGFRAAGREELSRDVLQSALDAVDPDERGPLYRDPKQLATAEPGRIPLALQEFSAAAVARIMADPKALACALGEVLSEPKPGVWFDGSSPHPAGGGLRLDRRSRMLYDDWFVFINGESYRAAGRDAKLMRQLADRHCLTAREVQSLSVGARGLIGQWSDAGWLIADPASD